MPTLSYIELWCIRRIFNPVAKSLQGSLGINCFDLSRIFFIITASFCIHTMTHIDVYEFDIWFVGFITLLLYSSVKMILGRESKIVMYEKAYMDERRFRMLRKWHEVYTAIICYLPVFLLMQCFKYARTPSPSDRSFELSIASMIYWVAICFMRSRPRKILPTKEWHAPWSTKWKP